MYFIIYDSPAESKGSGKDTLKEQGFVKKDLSDSILLAMQTLLHILSFATIVNT